MAEVTIAHLTATISKQSEDGKKRDDLQLKQLVTLNKSFDNYFKALKNKEGDDLEADRDKKAKAKSTKGDLPMFSAMVKDAKGGGFLAILGAIGAALAGLVAGVVAGLKESFQLVFRMISPKKLRDLFNIKIFGGIKTFFTAIGDVFSKAGTGKILKGDTFKALGRFTDTFKGIAKALMGPVKLLSKAKDGVVNSFKGLKSGFASFFTAGDIMQSQIKNFKSLFSQVATFGKGAKDAGGIFSKLGGLIKPFFDVFKRLGKFLGGPITVALFSIVDGFIGAFKGFTETEGSIFAKIYGAIQGAFAGVISGFVGGMLDLGKMIVGWIAGLFGFDSFKEKLESFSFQDMIFDALMFPFRSAMKAIDAFKEGGFTGVGKLLSDGMKSIWESLKGWVSGLFSLFSFGDKESPSPTQESVRTIRKNATSKPQTRLARQSDREESSDLGGRQGSARRINKRRQSVEEKKATANIVMMDNSSRTSAAPAAPASPAPVLVASNNSADPFDQGRSV